MWDLILVLFWFGCLLCLIGLLVYVVARNLTLLSEIEDLQRQKAQALEESWQWLDDLNAHMAAHRKNAQALYKSD